MNKELFDLIRKSIKLQEETDKMISYLTKHGLCPECGAPLVSERVEILKQPIPRLGGLWYKRTKKWDYRHICPFGHYESKGYYELKMPL